METNEEKGAYLEGNRKLIGVMQKDSKKFKEKGGWGFYAFEKNTRTSFVKDGGKGCYECHLGQKENDYVFSKYRS